LLLTQSYQAEVNVNDLTQGRNNVTRMRFYQVMNDALGLIIQS